MGFLIDGNKQDADDKREIIANEGEYSHLNNQELLELHRKTTNEVTKYSNFQMARKICLNSLYGALGNQWFRHYRLDNAEAITLTGQVAIRWIERKVNEYLNKVLGTADKDYVIASDTDSIYLDLGDLVSTIDRESNISRQRIVQVLDKFCEDKIVPFIDESYDELSDYFQCYEKTLVMKRECIAEKGIWTAKKRYILNVWDNEGVKYQEPKLKMMGIEAVKSSTPAPCRRYIKDCLNIIMTGTEEQLITYIEEKRKEHSNLTVEEIAFPRSANNVGKFRDPTTLYRKSTPLHIRGSIMFNHWLKEKDVLNKYNAINDGEKIKYVYLLIPNPTGENVMSFINIFPKEFNLNSMVDYDRMFTKGFLDPLQAILTTIGWSTERRNTLESFFS